MIRFLPILLLFLLSAGPVWGLEIRFKNDCLVEHVNIRLADVALFSDTGETARALGSRIISQSPPPGQTIFLRSLAIKQFVERSVQLPEDVYWSGSSTVTVKRDGIRIGSNEIQGIIDDFLKDHSSDLPTADIRFIPKSVPIPFILPKGELSHEVIPSNPGILGSSRFSIIFKIDDQVAKNMSVRGKLEALAEVVVSNTAIRRGEILESSDIRLAMMDISSMRDPGLQPSEFVGMQIKRSIRANTVMLQSYVEALPVVRRGERVKIVLHSGSMHVTAVGLAHNDGKMDEVIRVQNISSNKIIFCKVNGPGIVEVLL